MIDKYDVYSSHPNPSNMNITDNITGKRSARPGELAGQPPSKRAAYTPVPAPPQGGVDGHIYAMPFGDGPCQRGVNVVRLPGTLSSYTLASEGEGSGQL